MSEGPKAQNLIFSLHMHSPGELTQSQGFQHSVRVSLNSRFTSTCLVHSTIWSTADIPNFAWSPPPPDQLLHHLPHLTEWELHLHRKSPFFFLVGQNLPYEDHIVQPSCTFENWSSLTLFLFSHPLSTPSKSTGPLFRIYPGSN